MKVQLLCGLANSGLTQEDGMQQIVNQVLQLVQQAITAIFGLVTTIWNWVVAQVMGFANLPWNQLSVLKLIAAAVVVGVAGWFLWKAGKQLWSAFEKLLGAFAGFLSALVTALPPAIAGGIIFLIGAWALRTFTF